MASESAGIGSLIKKKDYTSAHDRKSLLGVRDNYAVLTDLMNQIGSKLTDVSTAQEKEFLNAYRVHMLNVQLELKELKAKVERAEESLQDDGEVSKLEDECNWFRGETNRLLANRATMSKDIKRMKNRLDSLADQQGYLREQLKTVLKKTRIVEAEIEFNGGRSMMSSVGHEAVDTQIPMPPTPATDTKLPDITKRHSTDLKKKKARTYKPKQYNGVQDSFVPQSISPTQRGAVVSMRKLNARQASSKAINMTPQEQLEALKLSRTPYELELEDLIKRQFLDIIQRRSQTVMSNSKSRLNVALSSTRDGVQEIAKEMTSDVPKEIEGMTGLGVEHFTDTDRYNVMVDFLSNYPIFCAVVQKAVMHLDSQP